MAFYDSLAATALSLIKKFGQAVTIDGEITGTYDPITGTTTGDVPVVISGFGVALSYKNTEMDGTIIKAGDLKLVCNALSTAPVEGYTVTVNGVKYRLMNVDPLNPAGTKVIYTVQIRV